MFRKFARVVVEAVKDSGAVQFHGVDDGTRLKVDDWRELRYIPASLVRQPPLCVMVKLERPPPRDTEEVEVKYLGHRKGSSPSSCLFVKLKLLFLRLSCGETDQRFL